jgi:hypothetical protein
MKFKKLLTGLFFLIFITSIHAEIRVGHARISGSLEMPLAVDAIVKTEVTFYEENADWTKDSAAVPFPYKGDWIFTWDSDSPGIVQFNGSINFGNYFSITDAGNLGGVTRQSYYNFTHLVSGTAEWDTSTNTLFYDFLPVQRDDGRASSISQFKPADCEKVKGLGAKKACKAFNESSLELEGFVLKLKFNQSLTMAKGELLMIQYGGSGITKSLTEAISEDLIVEIRME